MLRAAALVCLGAVSCSSPSVTVGVAQQAATTQGHQAASQYASEHSCAWQLVGDGSAMVWGVDPDCAPTGANPVGDCAANWPPDGFEGVWNGSLKWACRNWDHFTNNNFGLTNNSIAEQQMLSQAQAAGSIFNSNGDVNYRNLALRRAFDACHYAVDRNQCGHEWGNMVCDPNASSPSDACTSFVNNNNSATDVATSVRPLAIHDACLVSGYSNAAAYAAAERYLRHHAVGLNVDSWPNHCPAACPGGDANGPVDDACQNGGTNSDNTICLGDVQSVCSQVCHPTSCADQGKNCDQTTDGCGTILNCGTCQPGFTCTNGTCTQVCTAIRPQCGPYTDSCGNPHDAGPCPSGQTCVNGACECAPSCAGVACGQGDGCGGTCCSGSGCTVVSCYPQCQQPDACGVNCIPANDGMPCGNSGGTCNNGGCTNTCIGHFDCAGVCNGTAVVDCAGVCNGNATVDCAGVCNGGAHYDCAGVCNGGATVDCAGVCNGGATYDCAGICGGSTGYDCAGICGGSTTYDCAGVCGGGATYDACGVCGGDGSECGGGGCGGGCGGCGRGGCFEDF